MRKILVLLLVAFTALLPATALAEEDGEPGDDFNLRINGNFTLPAGATIDTLIVIRGTATIEGTVNGVLVVVDGTARVTGEVKDTLVVVNGTADIGATGRVHDLTLFRSDLVETPGSQITGDVTRTSALFSRGWAIAFGILLWVGWTLLALAGGFVWARFGGRQLGETVAVMADRPGPTILAGVIGVFAFPTAAVLALVTVVGIPIGLAILFVAIPAFIFLGHVVTGAWVGSMILSRPSLRERERPVAPTLVGLLVLQVASLIPAVGPGVFLVSAVWGGGAVLYRLVKGAPSVAAPPTPAPGPPPVTI